MACVAVELCASLNVKLECVLKSTLSIKKKSFLWKYTTHKIYVSNLIYNVILLTFKFYKYVYRTMVYGYP